MLKNHTKQPSEANSSRTLVFILILAAVFVLAAAGIYYAYRQEQKMRAVIGGTGDRTQAVADILARNASGTVAGDAADPARLLAEKAGRPSLGNPEAGLVIVEFADFECSVCHEEFYQIREFVNRHQNEVYYIYRHFPVKGNNSVYLAKASMCAFDQGKFWPLHDKLFLNQGQIESESAVSGAARQSGLDLSLFEKCLRDDKYRSLVFEDMNDAVNLGAQGTPTFFINGRKLEGAVKLADWESILIEYKELEKGN